MDGWLGTCGGMAVSQNWCWYPGQLDGYRWALDAWHLKKATKDRLTISLETEGEIPLHAQLARTTRKAHSIAPFCLHTHTEVRASGPRFPHYTLLYQPPHHLTPLDMGQQTSPILAQGVFAHITWKHTPLLRMCEVGCLERDVLYGQLW